MAAEVGTAGETATDPIDMTGGGEPAPEADSKFDWSQPLPSEAFPEAMREQMKGKSLGDFIGDGQKMRQAASQLGEKNKTLEARISELENKPAEDKPEMSQGEIDQLLKDRSEAEMVSEPDYQEALSIYYETGEVPTDFLDVMERRGYKPDRRTALKFLSFLKSERAEKIEKIGLAAEGAVEGAELWAWMESDQCSLSKAVLHGFNEQAEEGDYGFVGLLVRKHQEWSEDGGGSKRMTSGQGRYSGGQTVHGRPIRQQESQDITGPEFTEAVMDVRRKQRSGALSKAQARKDEAALFERRKATNEAAARRR